MPRKSKRGKGRSGAVKLKEKLKTEWDDISVESLEKIVLQLDSEHQNSVRDRIFAQTEHDAVNSYCSVTQNSVRNLKMQIKLMQHEIEHLEEENTIELKVYEEKTKHLSYDHTLKLRDSEEGKLASTTREREEHKYQLTRVEHEKTSVRDELIEVEVVYSEEIKQMKRQYNDELTDDRDKLNIELDKFHKKCEKHQRETENQLDLKKRVERRELEEQRNAHIYKLEMHHREACEQTKSHYEEMHIENSMTFRQLQDDKNRLTQVESQHLSFIKDLENKTNQLCGPLTECLSNVRYLVNMIINHLSLS